MARIVKEHDVRRSEILDVAQQLFYKKGYEQTSVQDILTAVGIAKGTFYHYFDSKQGLLEELVERLVAQTLDVIEPIITDRQLNALEKFEQFFFQIGQWKIERKALLLQLLRAYYLDENILLRHTLVVSSSEKVTPMLAAIIEQGVAEGIFSTAYVTETAEIILKTTQALSETVALLILDPPQDAHTMIERRVAANQQAIERMLQAPAGSLRLYDLSQIEQWLQ
jgi:AcrR family transcriptional regulator